MIHTNNRKGWVFTEEEKARMVRRRKDSTLIKKAISDWYQQLCHFPLHIHRSTNSDIDRETGSRKSDAMIIKYGIYSSRNNSILDMFKADEEQLKTWLCGLRIHIRGCGFSGDKFRVKITKVLDHRGIIIKCVYIQVIFVEVNDTFQKVKGEPISIVETVDSEDCDWPW